MRVKHTRTAQTIYRRPCLAALWLHAAAVLVLGVVLCNAGLAWVTLSRRAVAQNLTMQAAAAGNLVIAKSADDVTDPDILLSSPFTVTFAENTSGFLPCSHDDTVADTKLYYYKPGDSRSVSETTGLPRDNVAVTKTDVPQDSNNQSLYYRDFTVYLASVGGAMADVALTAAVAPGVSESDLTDTQRALTIDFWLDCHDGNGVVYQTSTNFGSGASAVTLAQNVTVPCNTGDDSGYITVVMRVYYDGALQKDATRTYVTSATLDTAQLSFAVTFRAYLPGEGGAS